MTIRIDPHLPVHRAIAESIVTAIRRGELAPGERLSTHRDLARELRISIGTVTRAYKDLIARGYAVAHVGRGTFVKPDLPDFRAFAISSGEEEGWNLGVNLPPPIDCDEELAHTLGILGSRRHPSDLLSSPAHGGSRDDRAAGAQWLSSLGYPADAGRIVVCCGAQHALFSVLSAVCRSGDVVLTDEFTFPGLLAAGRSLGLGIRPVGADSEGLDPDALDRLCAARQPVALYTCPTMHNPTCRTLGRKRREEIAGVLRDHDVLLIEDDPYRPLMPGAPPPLSSWLPDRSFYVATMTKVLGSGLRVAYTVTPEEHRTAVVSAVRATTFHASRLSTEVVTEWILSGTAHGIGRRVRAACRRRLTEARRSLGPWMSDDAGIGMHAFLEFPAGVSARRIVVEARKRGVRVQSGEAFSPVATPPKQVLRVSLGAVPRFADLKTALGRLRSVIRRGVA